MNAEECWMMKWSNKCEENVMNCDYDFCSYEPYIKPDYNWGATTTSIFYSCSIRTKIVAAKTESDFVFSPHCKISDNNCSLPHSIIVWDNTVIHKCPYYRVTTTNFFAMSDVVVSDWSRLAFQLLNSHLRHQRRPSKRRFNSR